VTDPERHAIEVAKLVAGWKYDNPHLLNRVPLGLQTYLMTLDQAVRGLQPVETKQGGA
jgi:hypothetical protein